MLISSLDYCKNQKNSFFQCKWVVVAKCWICTANNFYALIPYSHTQTHYQIHFENKQHAKLIRNLFVKKMEYLQKSKVEIKVFFKKTLLLNDLIIFFNYIRLWGKKICHTHRLGSPVTSNTSVFKPMFNHKNQAIQVFNLQAWSPKVCDNTNNTKYLLYLNLWPHNAKHLTG